MITIEKLTPADRPAWEELFRGYLAFYQRDEPQQTYDLAWERFLADDRIHALGARLDGELVGITHFLMHANTSGPDVCYLQDLFTAPEARGRGVARALIEAVTDFARERDCMRVYWMTHETNATARLLYDKVADTRGFLRYQIDL
ncbi:GNAT family N-acetyltransferase [Kitasatospora phosalacinea]|uniref:N-acetyltransferase n=1 Tax=Kitasatospora phosalacinea TaxID=2065 RepID=A0A9W6UN69_9ACTN|nr:GNAT family N-acetyltransferase [Kitasatospora phosalacinea]GLW56171.1 N-acetyltransferase [Kitasatospora phosalacinea]